jgi:hypothetical protein
MRRRIEESLARLASRSYQRRFISEATLDEYVLPDEMLDSAASILETTLNSKTLSRSFSEAELRSMEEALARFRDLQKDIRFDDPEFSVERDQGWVVVREVANDCLSVLRLDLERWEAENTTDRRDSGEA